MTITLPDTTDAAVCYFPGCAEPSRPDPATGRPAKYCEEVVDGVTHNRVNAWHRRRALAPGDAVASASPSPTTVSMARATLEDRLTELPDRLHELTAFLAEVVSEVQTASDLGAAGAEVLDAHQEALTKVAEANAQVAIAERVARDAQTRVVRAETERGEADAAAEAAVEEAVRMRAECDAQLANVEHRAAARIAEVEQARQLAAENHAEELESARQGAAEAHNTAVAAETMRGAALESAEREWRTCEQLRSEIAELRQGLAAAQAETSTARAAAVLAEAARDSAVVARQNAEVDRDRLIAEQRGLRDEHTEAIRQIRQDSDERVAALSAALEAASEASKAYQTQLNAALTTASTHEPTSRDRSRAKKTTSQARRS
jgi:hypothetical protein